MYASVSSDGIFTQANHISNNLFTIILLYYFIEAEVIKEKVSPIKKGMNMNEIIIYFRFPLYDDLSSNGMLLSHRA